MSMHNSVLHITNITRGLKTGTLPVVEGRSGVCTVMKSHNGQICSNDNSSTPKVADSSDVIMGS